MTMILETIITRDDSKTGNEFKMQAELTLEECHVDPNETSLKWSRKLSITKLNIPLKMKTETFERDLKMCLRRIFQYILTRAPHLREISLEKCRLDSFEEKLVKSTIGNENKSLKHPFYELLKIQNVRRTRYFLY